MQRNKKLLFFVLYYLIWISIFQRIIFSLELLVVVPDLIIFYVAFRTYDRKIGNVHVISRLVGTKYIYCIYFLLLSSLIVFIINHYSVISYLWGLRMFIRYPLLAWSIYMNFDYADVHRYVKVAYNAFYFNLGFCVLQFFTGARGDLMRGTMDCNGTLMMIALITFIVSMAEYFQRKITGVHFFFIVSGCFFIALGGEIKIMYFLFPLLFYGGYVLFRKFDLRHIIILVLGFFLLIPTMQYFMSLLYGEEYAEQVFDSEFIEEETTHAYSGTQGGMNRSTAIEITNSDILTDWPHFLFGFGLGSGTISDSFKTRVWYVYNYTFYWNFSTSYCLVELGWVGTILYLLLYVLLLLRLVYIYIRCDDLEKQKWAAIGIISVASSFIFFWYNDNPYFKYLPMWFLWGVCVASLKETNLHSESESPGLIEKE